MQSVISFPKYYLKTSGKWYLHAGIDISQTSEVNFKIISQMEPARLRKYWDMSYWIFSCECFSGMGELKPIKQADSDHKDGITGIKAKF